MAMLLPLGACSQANERICSTPDPIPYDGTWVEGDWKGCVHRWSYRLAPAPGTSAQVAKAVVAGCDDAILSAAVHGKNGTGETSDVRYEETIADADKSALFRVTQARAGHCDIS